jgi:DNA-binding transcriptional ArsR family regulator
MYFLYADAAPDSDLQLVLDALSDPTRRRIFQRVALAPETVGALAVEVGVSQPAASQHLRILRNAGLVTDRREGRRRWYQAAPRGLAELRTFIERYWGDALDGSPSTLPGAR